MRALGERTGELREFAEDDAVMPLGVRDVLAALLVLVGGLGCQRKHCKAAVVSGVNFCVFAEEADEGYFVLIHGGVSVSLISRILLGSHMAKPSEWARLPSAKKCFLGGAPKKSVLRCWPRLHTSSGSNRNPVRAVLAQHGYPLPQGVS